MNIAAIFPARHTIKPISEKLALRFLIVLVLVLALTAGFLYVQHQSHLRIIDALKRKYVTCMETATQAQQLDGTAASR
jgi:hypothetical protein